MILLDTTVLVYAVGEDHPLREPARRLLRAHGDGKVNASTTLEVIQEFTHVRSRRRGRADAVEMARRYVAALEPFEVSREDEDLGLELFAEHQSLGAFDSILAAVAVRRRVEALVSGDRAFDGVPDLRWVDLASPAVDQFVSLT